MGGSCDAIGGESSSVSGRYRGCGFTRRGTALAADPASPKAGPWPIKILGVSCSPRKGKTAGSNFSRNRFTVERDQTDSLYFLNSDVQRAVIDQERRDNIIQTYIKDSTLPYVDVEIKNVILDDLRQSPYSARIEFEKVYTNPADHTELKRERWTASVTYVFRENVKNNELAVNPLGLTIVRFRADQAFS